MEENHIYQYSLLNALMSGVSDTGITVAKFITKGNQGLGTFIRMDGELILLDGKVYQLGEKGVRQAADDERIPFGVAVNFVPQNTLSKPLHHKDDIDKILSELYTHHNNVFITYRITGYFDRLKARAVKGQEHDGQKLSELGQKQFVGTHENVKGTIVGFRSPHNWQGFSVAGEHLHFVDDDRKIGGHVLELLASQEVLIETAVVSNVHIELPTSEKFNEASLESDDAGIKQVEG